MHISMSHLALIASVSVPNESFSIWLCRETEQVPAEPFARSESRFNSTICFFIVLQIYWQPVTYVSDLITSQWCLPLQTASSKGQPFLLPAANMASVVSQALSCSEAISTQQAMGRGMKGKSILIFIQPTVQAFV